MIKKCGPHFRKYIFVKLSKYVYLYIGTYSLIHIQTYEHMRHVHINIYKIHVSKIRLQPCHYENYFFLFAGWFAWGEQRDEVTAADLCIVGILLCPLVKDALLWEAEKV